MVLLVFALPCENGEALTAACARCAAPGPGKSWYHHGREPVALAAASTLAPRVSLLRLRGGGVPKFFAWLSERYPLINHDVTSDVSMPAIDNLYLDMNGIIHPCTHGNSEELVDLTQNEMFLKIFAFLDELVHVVKPQKTLFLAVDGVAPRAKMNQQRARRFKAAKDLTEKLEKASTRGGHVPKEPFDSNCITPGTTFMADLSNCLHYYIRYKMGCDSTWKTPTIILSGHEVPGEGEHKIMEYIRREKMQADYLPNMRHCIYGNDADLIMLALASHEPHFVLLRQKENYQPPRRGRGGPQTLNKAEAQEKEKSKGWQLMHISLVRDYLHLELQTLYQPMKDAGLEYDLERLVDDFVLICYFVGNDFLPHLPALDIRTGGLDAMMRIYKRLLPVWGAYLTHSGDISLPRLGDFFSELGQIEERMFKDRAASANRGDHKAVGGHFREIEDTPSRADRQQQQLEDAEFSAHAARHGVGFGAAHEAALASLPRAAAGAESGGIIQAAGGGADVAWKQEYYRSKLSLAPEDAEGLQALVRKYIEGVCWCYYYYYRGCVSWRWFYPYHYSPLASDLHAARLKTLHINFDLGTPFQPFQQLLAVLPRASSSLLPPPHSALMYKSSIADSYPDKFQVDMDGKNWEWEAVVLIPFIDEALLFKETERIHESALTAVQAARNQHGLNKRYTYDRLAPPNTNAPVEPSPMGGALPPLACSSVACVLEDFRPFPAERPQFEPVLCAGVSIGPNACAGYPSLFSRPLHVPVLSKANLEMFGRRSRRESLCLRFADSVPLTSSIAVDNGMLSRTDVKSQIAQDCKLELVAKTLLGNACFVSWPHWRPGVLMAMTDGKKRVTRDSQGKLCVHVLTPQEKSQHEGARKSQHTEWLQVNFLKSRFHNELGKRVEHSLLRNSHSELP